MEIKDVENLAEFAKIELTEEEKTKLLKDMKGILTYVRQIEEVELPDSEIEHSHRNIWRDDEPRVGEPQFSTELIKEQFPDSQDGFLKVKKIL